MALLKNKDVLKMSDSEKKSRIKDLKLELIRSNVTANKTNAKTKEIKRAVARLLTSMNKKNKLNKSSDKKSEKELKK